MADYTSGAGPVGNTSGSAQQVGGTNRLAKGAWQLTPELIAEIQPYLSFDLAKVVRAPTAMQPGERRYVVPGAARSGQMTAPQNRDVTSEYTSILNQIRSRDNTSIYGTAGSVSGDSATRAFHEVYGGRNQAGGSSLWHGTMPDTYDDQAGVRYDATGKPIARPQGQWNTPAALQPDRPGFVTPDRYANTTYADAQARQFQIDHPGYFQVGESQTNKGSYDRGALDTNNLPASYYPNGVADPNSMVKYDDKYGYIAPIALQKQSRPDFLSKYGQYIPLAFFGAGVAASAMGGGLTQAAAPVSTGVPSSTAASLTQAAAPIVEGVPSSVAAGSTGAIGGGAGGMGGGGVGGLGGGTLGEFGTAGTGSPGVFGGLFNTSTAAGGGGGIDWQSTLGTVGSALAGGGGGAGGGYGGLIGSLVGAGLSIYQARQVADSMQVQDKSTDYSKTSGGHTSFDPSIRGLQDQSMLRNQELEGGVMGYGTAFRARSDENKDQYDKLYAELTSNQNPYIQARVNPLKEQIAGSRGQIQRNQGLRGVGGSSFGNDELTNFDFGAQRQLGDASAMATHDALGSRSSTLGSLAGLNQNRLTGETQLTNTLNTLNSNRTGIAKDRAALEQAGLGLSATSEAATRLSEQQKQEMYARLLAGLVG